MIWITNGEENIQFFGAEEDIPEGWKRGRVVLDTWYTDGEIEIKVKNDLTPPPNFKKGRIRKIYYTNGVKDIKLKPGSEIPEGFYRGRTFKVNLTQEAEEERRGKISKTLKSKSAKEKARIFLKSLQTKESRYGDANFNNIDKRKQTCEVLYGDCNFSNREAYRETMNAKSEDEKKLINHKRSESLKNYHKQLSPEEKEEHFKNYYGRIVSEETRQKLSSAWTPEKIEHMLAKYSETCMSKYGVPYFCMSSSCRKTNGRESKPNLNFKQLLIENNLFISDDENREFPILNRSYDFKINNTLIEINPAGTHNSTKSPFGDHKGIDKNYHFNKTKLAVDNGYRVINVWDWDDIDKVIGLLLPRETIYARKCILKDVSKDDAKTFLNNFHLQGYAKDEIRIGLYYEGNLISIMTFGKPRYNKKYQYELIRYCSSYNVIGGAEKLFNYFLKTYAPESVISYCDLSKFKGDTYTKLGFSLKSTSISKHWYNIRTKVHITDNFLRQRGFDQLFGKQYGCYGKGSSNEQLMIDHDFVEIYDCGQACYTYKNS